MLHNVNVPSSHIDSGMHILVGCLYFVVSLFFSVVSLFIYFFLLFHYLST